MSIKTLMAAGIVAIAGSSAIAQTGEPTDADNAMRSELLADASSRSSLLGSSSSGFDESGFFIDNGDGFRLNINGVIQFRYLYNNSDYPGREDDTLGFDFGETSLRFSGTVHEHVDFYIEGDFNNDGGDFWLNEAWTRLNLDGAQDGLSLTVGQFTAPFSREDIADEGHQLSIGQSIVSTAFGAGQTQGVQLGWDADRFRAAVSFNDGMRAANTDYTMETADYGVTGRFEWLAAGNFDQFDDFTSERDDEFGLLVGVAGHFEDGGETAGTMDTRVLTYAADIGVERSGFNAMVAGYGRNVESPMGDFDDFGYLAQAGYRVTDKDEIFGRYEGIIADSDRGLAEDNMNFITVGYNRYIFGHALKFTTDVVYALEETSGLATFGDFSGLGMLGSMDQGEYAIRGQIQLAF